MLREPCTLPSRRSDEAIIEQAAPFDAPEPEATGDKVPTRVVAAMFGGIRDWNDLKRRYPGSTRMLDVIANEAWGVNRAAS
jgi:hypothetical protein